MIYKYYFAELFWEVGGKLEICGSKVVRLYFWQSPVKAYQRLSGNYVKVPVNMKRIG